MSKQVYKFEDNEANGFGYHETGKDDHEKNGDSIIRNPTRLSYLIFKPIDPLYLLKIHQKISLYLLRMDIY